MANLWSEVGLLARTGELDHIAYAHIVSACRQAYPDASGGIVYEKIGGE